MTVRTDPAVFPAYKPTLPNVIRDVTQKFGERVFAIQGEQRLSYAELDAQSAHLARGLLALGVGKGTRIGLMMPNDLDWPQAFFAAARIGAFTVGLSTLFQAREIAWALERADIDTLLVTGRYLHNDYLDRLEHALPELKEQTGPQLFMRSHPYLRRIVVWGDVADIKQRPWALHGPDALHAAAAARPQIDADYLRRVEDQVAPADWVIGICTSGSTAEPKIVVHTHGSMVRTTHAFQPYRPMTAADRNYPGMPFFWIGGLNDNLFPVLYAGATMVLSTTPRADDVLDAVLAHGVTRISVWPPQKVALLERAKARGIDLSHIRFAQMDPKYPDGTPIPAAKRRASLLGMTETFGPHSVGLLGEEVPPELAGSWGHVFEGVERVVVDPARVRDVTRQPLAAGEKGELLVRGFSLMDGYYKRERGEVFTADGWFPTGDLVHINADGTSFFHGRHSEMIKTGGANVAPREVEDALQRLPGVREATVFGCPDEVKGEVVVAVVVAREGADVDPAQLIATLRGEISAYKVPQKIFVMAHDDIPRTDSGKPKKNLLKDMVLQQQAAQAEFNRKA